MPAPDLRVRFAVDDAALTLLHARAFSLEPADPPTPWAARLTRHSVTWVGAFRDDALVGFVHACWDGGAHAFLLDAVVDPAHQGRGTGRALVGRLVGEVRAAGCDWLHVDHEPHLDGFYRRAGSVRRRRGCCGCETRAWATRVDRGPRRTGRRCPPLHSAP